MHTKRMLRFLAFARRVKVFFIVFLDDQRVFIPIIF